MYTGSSPRVRGAGHDAVPQAHEEGIIPARAGSRPSMPASRPCRRDHPRACGEQVSSARVVRLSQGSSPRVRGAEAGSVLIAGRLGIIPARAGSSSCPAPVRAQTWDHPRACGEQSRDRRLHQGRGGSSPRVRGAGLDSRGGGFGSGIIPARAGSSRRYIPPCGASRDHPRACGEQSSARLVVNMIKGSSPRVRGAVIRRF